MRAYARNASIDVGAGAVDERWRGHLRRPGAPSTRCPPPSHPHGVCSGMLAQPTALPALAYRICFSKLISPLPLRPLLLAALNSSTHTIATISKSRTRMTA